MRVQYCSRASQQWKPNKSLGGEISKVYDIWCKIYFFINSTIIRSNIALKQTLEQTDGKVCKDCSKAKSAYLEAF